VKRQPVTAAGVLGLHLLGLLLAWQAAPQRSTTSAPTASPAVLRVALVQPLAPAQQAPAPQREVAAPDQPATPPQQIVPPVQVPQRPQAPRPAPTEQPAPTASLAPPLTPEAPPAQQAAATAPAAALAAAPAAALPPRPVAAPAATAPAPALVQAQARRDDCPPAPHPAVLRERGIEGEVRLLVRVGTDGRAAEVKLQQPSGWRLFDQAALAQAQACRFIPARRGAQSEESWVEFPVRFSLQG
jgi:protein TonB